MKQTKIETKRHSLAHIMALALQRLYKDVKFGVGPDIEMGFYYDVELAKKLNPDDLNKIENEMRKIINENLCFIKVELPLKESLDLFRKLNQSYKVELLKDIQKYGTTETKEIKKQQKRPKIKTVTIYILGDNESVKRIKGMKKISKNDLLKLKDKIFIDLCRGPHIKNTKEISEDSFSLINISGAYWRGSEKNKMLQRIYGVAFADKNELNEYLSMIDEAKKRDHRKLNEVLDLYGIYDEIGSGLVLFHPNGAIIRKNIEDFWKEEHLKRGYQLVYTPHIANINLWKTSGHLSFYKESMFPPMYDENITFQLKPMNCPFHIAIFKSKVHSYKELPLRYGEIGTVYREEKSGVVQGLFRVRSISQDDAHIFCRSSQLKDEIVNIIELAKFMMKTFGFQNYDVCLSTRPDKYIGSVKLWDKATKALKYALESMEMPYTIDKGAGAFYGPKIDIVLKDALNRGWQGPTIQLDFNLPEKFDVTYVNEKGKKEKAVMIHRTVLGSMERFLGCLIEHYAGAFPLWLAPTQLIILPVGKQSLSYAQSIEALLKSKSFRVELELNNETLSKRIRDAELKKIPYVVVIGEKEEAHNIIAVRERGTGDLGAFSVQDFIERLQNEINNKTIK